MKRLQPCERYGATVMPSKRNGLAEALRRKRADAAAEQAQWYNELLKEDDADDSTSCGSTVDEV